jgi:hypothetical protein
VLSLCLYKPLWDLKPDKNPAVMHYSIASTAAYWYNGRGFVWKSSVDEENVLYNFTYGER